MITPTEEQQRRSRLAALNGRAKAVVGIIGALAVIALINLQQPADDARVRARPPLAIGDRPPAYIPPSLDADARRRLSLDLGGGQCEWKPPEYDVPNDIPFFKTLIAGFPSSDKRMTFTQMEALTGWPARDEWDFIFFGSANHPFIKSNYPHHEGYWSWGSRAQQVVMVVRNMRRTMVEYHDILWDIATAKNAGMNPRNVLYLYRPLPITSFFEWRDLRVMDEISWYGWFIDYWMEGGLRRDIFSHELTGEDAWPYFPENEERGECKNDPFHAHTTLDVTCTNTGIVNPPTPPPTQSPTPAPTPFPTRSPSVSPTAGPTTGSPTYTNQTLSPTESNLTQSPSHGPTPYPTPPPTPNPVAPAPIAVQPTPNLFSSAYACCEHHFPGQACSVIDVCPTPSPTPPITASYDPHCSGGEIANGCEPVAVVSAEKLRSLGPEGAAETVTIANTLVGPGKDGISQYVIDNQAWQCIWEELIPNMKGNRMVRDRQGYQETDYNFSAEMLEAMIAELDRLIVKYGNSYWNAKATANRLVELLMEHRALIQMELNDVNAGTRALAERDFLGPRERQRRRKLQAEQEGRVEEEVSVEEKKEHFEYFMALEEEVKTQRRKDRARERQEERILAGKAKKNQ